jgi:hypothetical protein
MAEETTRQFINRRKRELTFQISALRGQLGSKEEELAELNRMEAALTIAGSAPTPAVAKTDKKSCQKWDCSHLRHSKCRPKGATEVNLPPLSPTSVRYLDEMSSPYQLTNWRTELLRMSGHL